MNTEMMKRAAATLTGMLLASFALASPAHASHYRGGSVANSVTDGGILALNVFTLWRSDGVGSPSFTLYTGSGGTGAIAAIPLTATVNPYSSGTEYGGSGYVVRRDTFTYNMGALSPGTYYARWTSAARVSGINNAPEGSFALETVIRFNGVGAGLGNGGPSILPATIDIIGRGAAYSQNLNTVDPEGTPVNSQFLGGTLGGGAIAPNYGPNFDIPGIGLDASLGTVSISGANTLGLALGRWVYKVRVTDGSGATAERDVLVLVQDLVGNSAPVLNPIGAKAVAVNTPLSFNVTATDPNSGQLLTMRASLLPAGASFPTATATSPATAGSTFTWTPVNGQEGVHQVFFEVFDSANTPLIDTETVEITVGGANDPPVLDPVGNRSVANGGTLTFSISGSDPDPGQVLAYSAFFLPAGATFTPATQTFSWTPSPAQYNSVFTGITFRATDNGIPNLFDSEAVSITVGGGNQSPSIAAIAPQTVVVGQLLQFSVDASDANLTQTLTLTSFGALPAGASFLGATGTSPRTGTFSWTPGSGDVGSHTVQFRVEDSGTPILSSIRSVSIEVTNLCQNDVDCDDGIACTTDVCLPASVDADSFGCVRTPVGSACADANDCTADVCTAGSGCSNPPEASATPCGNPSDTACDNPDTCDGSGSCLVNYEPTTAVCRADTGQCDVVEHCDGAGNCPVDAFEAVSVGCTGGSQAGSCDNDPGDHCSGAASTCIDVYKSAAVVCRGDGGQCDVAENCTGTSGACPADSFESVATACTGASQAATCDDDAADHCSGAANTCVDAFRAVSVVCRADAGQCDVAENCTGTNAICPGDAYEPGGTACGSAGDTDCDHPDTCNGGGSCLPNYEVAGTVCDDGKTCTIEDNCNGAGDCNAQTTLFSDSCTWFAVGSGDDVRGHGGHSSDITGDLCFQRAKIFAFTAVTGNVVATEALGSKALRFGEGSTVSGDIVTGGGGLFAIKGSVLPHLAPAATSLAGGLTAAKELPASGNYDTTGTSSLVADCLGARTDVNDGVAAIEALDANQSHGEIEILAGVTIDFVPSVPGGVNVIDFASIRGARDTTINVDGGGNPDTVMIVRIDNRFQLRERSALVMTNGMQSRNFILYVRRGRTDIGNFSTVEGTIYGGGFVRIGEEVLFDGQLFGGHGRMEINAGVLGTLVPNEIVLP